MLAPTSGDRFLGGLVSLELLASLVLLVALVFLELLFLLDNLKNNVHHSQAKCRSSYHHQHAA